MKWNLSSVWWTSGNKVTSGCLVMRLCFLGVARARCCSVVDLAQSQGCRVWGNVQLLKNYFHARGVVSNAFSKSLVATPSILGGGVLGSSLSHDQWHMLYGTTWCLHAGWGTIKTIQMSNCFLIIREAISDQIWEAPWGLKVGDGGEPKEACNTAPQGASWSQLCWFMSMLIPRCRLTEEEATERRNWIILCKI